ncbi:HTH-type transcriptional repressor PurR [Trichinella spiralis]|uniref:HTH-type transcriptional repressor PurR n=2 Tax=Trichinella spiralis TaxID=6334 RepID=A0ABR3L0P5_TRISP|nr:hypothetical protein T01_15162 [Trichinella spiralis]
MDTFEEFDILNQRREAIVAMIDQLMRWATDLSVVLIEQYPRMSLEHYMMITTEITMMCEDMAQLQQDEDSAMDAIFAMFGIQDNHYIATRRRRRL